MTGLPQLKEYLLRRIRTMTERTSRRRQSEDAIIREPLVPNIAVLSDLQALHERDTALSDNAARLLTECRRSLSDFDYDRARMHFDETLGVCRLRQHLAELQMDLSRHDTHLHLVHSACLHELYRSLVTTADEAIAYMIGSRIGPVLMMERFVLLPLDSASRGHANANPEFIRKLLIECERYGTVLAAYFHTHPGHGSGNTQPSDIDLTTQADKERGGYSTIGGIFSRDGYLRFYADQLQFRVRVLGKEVECEGTNLFRLSA